MVILQPFLSDFFSVTRGYSLSVAFQMISLYFGIRYIKYYLSKDLYFSIFFGAIGVIANFILLNFYIPITLQKAYKGKLSILATKSYNAISKALFTEAFPTIIRSIKAICL